MTFYLYRIIRLLFTLYSAAIIARVLLPMLGMSYAHPVMRFLYNITEPLLGPIRRRMPLAGPLDLSPMVLLFAVWLVEQILLMVVMSW